MQRLFAFILTGTLFLSLSLPIHAKGRKQWTPQQAWKWQQETGPIRGFNAPASAYPDMTREQIFRKAASLGLNSVRSWIGGKNEEEQIAAIRSFLDLSEKYGMTFSPVLSLYERYFHDQNLTEEQRLQKAEHFIRTIIRTFAKEKRITMWDIWNEPSEAQNETTLRQMDWLEKMVQWCREENPSQPITSSIFWEGSEYDSTTVYFKRRMEIESMMDIHNFHSYRLIQANHTQPQTFIRWFRQMDGRPLICTECLARPVGGGLTRTLKLFAKEHVNFYLWGMHITDNRNWAVEWGHSTYNPYEPMHHNLLYSDGYDYDYREIEAIRNFKFAAPGEQVYEPLAQSERWTTDRAWKWAALGLVKGFTPNAGLQAGNNVRLQLSYAEFASDEALFLKKFEQQLTDADARGQRVLPVLLTDEDIQAAFGEPIPSTKELDTYPNDFAEYGDIYQAYPINEMASTPTNRKAIPQFLSSDFASSIAIQPAEALAFSKKNTTRNILAYINKVVRTYYVDHRIQAWDLYYHPGQSITDKKELSMLISQVFDLVRYICPTQPCFMTPFVSVKDFKPDFKYVENLIHARPGGWNQLQFTGGSNAALVYKIWSLSDVAAFSSEMKAPETGWLMSICYRFGRPIYCSYWHAPQTSEIEPTLKLFAKSHVFWYSDQPLNPEVVSQFQFLPINTKRD